MDGLRRPVGDQPPTVYWRRRLVAVAVLVALALLLWFLISATLAGEDEPGASPTASTSPQAQAVDSNDPGRECTADDVTLAVEVSPETPSVGSVPAFDVAVEHTGDAACMLSTATEGTDLSVRSGEWIYYSTTYCPDSSAFPDAEWILQPGDNEALQATWSGERVDEDCSVLEPESGAGTYVASVAIGGVPAPEASFQLVSG
ncbi:hypothetical protein ACNI3K_03265 [Demequina sp. SO4-13]|uniref:hypothetical protein n=1 Tax=Demequina sp. SO4-13 TaxID=3401027 RepID=UPI003AF92CA7